MRTWSAETLILCLLQDISSRIRISCRVFARIRLCHQAIPLRITRAAQRDTSIIRLFRTHSLNDDRRHPCNYITRLAAASHNARSTSTVCRAIITRGGETASFSSNPAILNGYCASPKFLQDSAATSLQPARPARSRKSGSASGLGRLQTADAFNPDVMVEVTGVIYATITKWRSDVFRETRDTPSARRAARFPSEPLRLAVATGAYAPLSGENEHAL